MSGTDNQSTKSKPITALKAIFDIAAGLVVGGLTSLYTGAALGMVAGCATTKLSASFISRDTVINLKNRVVNFVTRPANS